MLTGLYSAASGMIIQERVQDVLAQNIASSQMPGYKREDVVIRSFPDVTLTQTYHGLSGSNNKDRFNHAIGRVGTGAGVDWVYVNHSEGSMNYSGNKNDLALSGDGFFSVITPDGTRFTSSGTFHVDSEGYLSNSQGFRLQGQGVNNGRQPGPIQVGSNDFNVDSWGRVTIQRPDPNSKIPTDVVVDQIRVVDFENKDRLFREPGNIFRVEEGDQDNFKIPDRFRVLQGYVEQSNTHITTEMVKLIDSYRIHEASSKVIKSLDQTLQKAVNEIAR